MISHEIVSVECTCQLELTLNEFGAMSPYLPIPPHISQLELTFNEFGELALNEFGTAASGEAAARGTTGAGGSSTGDGADNDILHWQVQLTGACMLPRPSPERRAGRMHAGAADGLGLLADARAALAASSVRQVQVPAVVGRLRR